MSCLFLLIGQMADRILTHDHVDDVEGEDVNGEQGEGHGEQVEVSVVPLAHTVAYPRTVVIKTVCDKEKKGQRINMQSCTPAFREKRHLEIKQVLKIHQYQLQSFSQTQLCASASVNLQSKYSDHFLFAPPLL